METLGDLRLRGLEGEARWDDDGKVMTELSLKAISLELI